MNLQCIKCGSEGCSYASNVANDFIPHFCEYHQNDMLSLKVAHKRSHSILKYDISIQQFKERSLAFREDVSLVLKTAQIQRNKKYFPPQSKRARQHNLYHLIIVKRKVMMTLRKISMQCIMRKAVRQELMIHIPYWAKCTV